MEPVAASEKFASFLFGRQDILADSTGNSFVTDDMANRGICLNFFGGGSYKNGL
jgi:hypothetical protein